jgi:D-3-phosphoglycerate dehydrogenase
VRILVADKLSDAGVAALSEHHDVDVKTGLSKDELVAIAGDYHGIVVRSATTIDADVIAVATELKVVARAGVGLDNVDVDAATRSGVIVCNAPQSNVISAAEHTVALIASLARNIPQAHAALVAGSWERSAWTGIELYGKTLGVLGLGRIGTLVAQRCNAFGMKLVAYDPFVAPERAARQGVTLLDTVDEVLAAADVVTIHLPKTPDTLGLLDADRLRLMKPTARLVNVARGGIVVEADLAEAVRDGVIAGAALDVFVAEPTTTSPLFGLPNVIVTPHLGASTGEAQDKAGTQVAEAVNLALAGEFVPTAVNVAGGPVDDVVKPFLPLGEKLGRLFTALVGEGTTGEVSIEFHGAIASADCRVLGLSVLKGMLAAVVNEPVTFVNVPLLARERGLSIREVYEPASADYVSLVRVVGAGRDGDETAVCGTVFQPGGRERLVEVWNSAVDIEPTEHMAFFRYTDRPGIIGRVGSGFGDAGVNIASAQVGRATAGGTAVMAVALDDAPSRATLTAISDDIGAIEARAVTLG